MIDIARCLPNVSDGPWSSHVQSRAPLLPHQVFNDSDHFCKIPEADAWASTCFSVPRHLITSCCHGITYNIHNIHNIHLHNINVHMYIYNYIVCVYIYILNIHIRNLYNLVSTYLGRTNLQDRTSVHKWAQATTFRLAITARTSGSVQRMRCKSHCSVKSYALCCTYSFCSGHVQPCSMSKCCSK